MYCLREKSRETPVRTSEVVELFVFKTKKLMKTVQELVWGLPQDVSWQNSKQ